MENFYSFGLPKEITDALEQMKFTVPTPIQAQVIPAAMEGKDVLGAAQTGTGKTGAFGIPLVSAVMTSDDKAGLIMTPTRELAVQVMAMLKSFLGKKQKNIHAALLIGGQSIVQQFNQLKAKPRIIVGTPGRINDHLRRGSLKLSNITHLVLDETDRMLDMGFAPQIDEILKYVPEQRQTFLFSATFPKNILVMSKKYLNDPVRVMVGEQNAPAAKLNQEIVYVSEDGKNKELNFQLESRAGSIIIFMKTKFGAERMAKKLRESDHSVDVIHGDLKHAKRERTLDAFRKEKYRIMVATDVAARGLDIAHVKHVINYDLPQCPEDYIHRIGRTARAGAEGSALSFVTPMERSKWKIISNMLSSKFIANSKEINKTDVIFDDKKKSNSNHKRRVNDGNVRNFNSEKTVGKDVVNFKRREKPKFPKKDGAVAAKRPKKSGQRKFFG